MECYGELDCTTIIESLNKQGQLCNRKNIAKSYVKIGRDELRDIVLKVNSESFILKDFKILQRFAKEGKATLLFTKLNKNILFSNAPPEKLLVFLKLLRIKTGIQSTNATDRMRLYSSSAKAFEDISPLTVHDVKKFQNRTNLKSPIQQSLPLKRKSTDITPVRVTKRGLECVEGNARKKLHSEPLQLVKLGRNTGQTQKEIITSSQLDSSIMVKKRVNLSGKLTREQIQILKAVRQGYNVFFTGSAGTGKSYLLKKIIGSLPPEGTVASASTGVAACQIGGVTLHSFAGIGSGEASIEQCIKLASRSSVIRNWKRCSTLIIDEISMVDSSFFEKLEKIARMIRKDDRPFGGIQLVLCGDFLQLPPVQEKSFCFQSKCWSACVQMKFELTDVKRQSDQEFVNILQYIRVGKCPEHIYKKLLETRHHQIEKCGIQPTRLCTHKDSVEEINNIKMTNLKGEKRVFYATDSETAYTTQMDKSLQVPYKLELKEGAQVMLTRNLNVAVGLVNGARGVVTKFASDKDGMPFVKFSEGSELLMKRERFPFKTNSGVVTRSQIPLKLAWAISIHKSQGLTLDCCEVSLSRVFEHGQAYVALSRAKSLDGLRVLDITPNCVKAHTEVLKFYIRLRREIRMMSVEDKENGGDE